MWIIWWKPPTIKLWPPIQAPISHGSQTSQKRKVEFLHLWGFLKKPTLKIIVGNVLISLKHVKSIQNACRIIIYSTDTYAEASWLGVPKQNYSITGILCISDTWNHRFQMYICNVYIYMYIPPGKDRKIATKLMGFSWPLTFKAKKLCCCFGAMALSKTTANLLPRFVFAVP